MSAVPPIGTDAARESAADDASPWLREVAGSGAKDAPQITRRPAALRGLRQQE